MIKISIRKMQEVEKFWRTIETKGIVSPFQSYDWLSVQLKRPENAGINFVIVGEKGAETVFILPMSMYKIARISVCGWSGGKHQNVNKGLYTPEIIAEMDPSHVKQIIELITSTYPQTSLFYFEKQPEYLNTYLNIFFAARFSIRKPRCDVSRSNEQRF